MKKSKPIDREPRAVSFKIQTEHGLIAFRLPARIEQVVKILSSQRRRINAQAVREQAANAQDSTGRTFYETAKAARFPGLLLEDKPA